jgi:predicted nuclease with TOPRIM domain
MTWKDIIKKAENIEEKIDNVIDECESLQRWDDDSHSTISTILDELKPQIVEKDYQESIDKAEQEVWNALGAYNGSLDDLVELLSEFKDEFKGEEMRSSVGVSTGAEAYPDKSNIHPAFKDYELGDNEQWGEGPNGLLIPKPIDTMYGAEW